MECLHVVLTWPGMRLGLPGRQAQWGTGAACLSTTENIFAQFCICRYRQHLTPARAQPGKICKEEDNISSCALKLES